MTNIYTPRLHGKTIYEWTQLGLFTMKDIKAYAEMLENQLELEFDERHTVYMNILEIKGISS